MRATLLRAVERGQRLELRIEERRHEPAPRYSVHLACALPKGERQHVLLDMATQLGMTRFTPLDCARSIVKPGPNSAARWRKICLEACKQSRRLHLPVIEPPTSLEEFLAHRANGGLWIAHPSASPGADVSPSAANDVTLLVGPEGGFTEAEIGELLARGGKTVSLGPNILRVETAAMALLAAVAWMRSGDAYPGCPSCGNSLPKNFC